MRQEGTEMRLLLASAIILGTMSQATFAQALPTSNPVSPARPSCHAELAAFTQLWVTANYPIPAKAAQARVVGQNGFETTGETLTYMRGQFHLASQECAVGLDGSALQRVSALKVKLAGQARH
jgi:hypothetical protein